MHNHRICLEEEKDLISSIKQEIDHITDLKLHALHRNPLGKIDQAKVAEESRVEFFEALTHTLDRVMETCDQFYKKLKIDDPFLYAKIETAIGAVSEKLALCHSIQDLLELQKPILSERDKKNIYSLALKYFKSEEFESAHLFFTFLSLIEPENAHIWLGKAMIEQNLGRYEEALVSYSSVVAMTPENLAAYLHIMETLILMKRLDEAQQVYDSFMREIDAASYAHHSYVRSKLEEMSACFKRAKKGA